MIKRILSTLISICMLCILLPTDVFAVTDYNIWVGGTKVTSANESGVTGDGISGTVTYNASNNTLTLNNATITGYYETTSNQWNGIYMLNDLRIELIGSNTISFTPTKRGMGIYSFGSITLIGSGSLDITLGNSENSNLGIFTTGNTISITGCTVTATTGNASSTDYSTATGGIYINNNGSISITDATVTAIGGSTVQGSSYGIVGKLNITNSTVRASGYNYAIGSKEVIAPNSKVTASMYRTGDGAITINSSSILSQQYKYVYITPGLTNAQAVAAAKTAIVGGTVNVAFGADQTAKTAAVQTYVNNLLTGDAAGVTATVTYSSGNDYNVALSKDGVNDTTTITMTINVAPNPADISSVAAAKTAILSGIAKVAFADVQTAKTAAVQTYINTLLTGDAEGVTAAVTFVSGNEYSVALSKGGVNETIKVYAVTEYDIWVGGTRVTSANESGVTGDGISGTVTYNASNNTLTLSNAAITGYYETTSNQCCGIYQKNDLRIELIGSNSISFTPTKSGAGIYSSLGSITLIGNGSLDITLGNSVDDNIGIYTIGKNISITGCTVTATTGNSSSLQSCKNAGICTNDYYNCTITITDATVTAIGTSLYKYSYGIMGNLSVTNSKVRIIGNGNAFWSGQAVSSSDSKFTASIYVTGSGAKTVSAAEAIMSGYKYVYISLMPTDAQAVAAAKTAILSGTAKVAFADVQTAKTSAVQTYANKLLTGDAEGVTAAVTFVSGNEYSVALSKGGVNETIKVYAVTEYDIWVGGTRVTSANESGVTGDGISGTVTYNASNNTLTLSNAAITGYYETIIKQSCGIYQENDLRIELIGSNSISFTPTKSGVGIYTYNGSITLIGNGSLNITLGDSVDASLGIYARNNNAISITGCTVTITTGNASSKDDSTTSGIYISSFTNNKITITDATVTAIAGTSARGYSIGISGKLYITNSTVRATGYNWAINSAEIIAPNSKVSASQDRTGANAITIRYDNIMSAFYKYVYITPGPTNAQAVAAAKTAIVGGTVNVAFGANQAAKTAAVLTYVNNLLTGDAAGVTATVTYSSGNDYNVALSKGEVNDTTSITMTINVAPNPADISSVAVAKAAIVGGTVNVAFGADQAAKTAAVQTYVNNLLTGAAAGVEATVTYSSGNNYNVALSKGGANDSKTITMTINVAPNPADVSSVDAAKAAIVGGTVNVAFGASQAAKTAAVQTYVNNLLTGDAAGVTATVTYSSGNNYNVALSKGGVNGVKTIAMTIIVAPNPADVSSVAAAKTAITGGTVNVAFGADQAAKTAAVQTYVNNLLTGDAAGVTATVTYSSGNDYSVALSKGGVNDSTTITMTINVAPDIDDTSSVAAAKTAIVGGIVNVAFGADQAAKTAAVQTYVNNLLTGDAAGVTATVTYSSGNNYNVALSKGGVNDTTTITMTINVAPDPDIAIVNAAKTAAEAATYSNLSQAMATDEAVIKNALKVSAEAAINNNTVTVKVDKVSHTPPVAGTAADPDGTNGSYIFTITLSKGVQTRTTTQKTITITATAYSAPTYIVSGNVKDTLENNVSNAAVKLMFGQTQIGSTAITNTQGEFNITGIPNGTYNLVVSKGDIIVTTLIIVSGGNYASGVITLPNGITNSIVEVKSNTPPIVVGGLDAQFTASASSEDNKGITESDKTVVASGGTVEIKFIAEKKTENAAPNASNIAIRAAADGKTVGTFLDISVVKTVITSDGSSTATTTLVELPSLIEILIPLEEALQGKSNYVVYRYHGSAVDTITTTANADGEMIELINNNTTIRLKVKKFSTYAVSYTTPSAPPTGGGSGSSTAPATITAKESDGGKITISTDKKLANITPADGYVIADVLVDGNSVGAIEKYTFADNKDHTIAAVFVTESSLPYYLQNDEKTYIGFSMISGKIYKYIAPAGITVAFKENPKNFTDNTIAWAKSSIDFVTERELFLGTSQNTFSPNESMTRAMFVTVIGRLYERSYGSVSAASTFSDVDTDAYYAKYVSWANENGIIKGIGGNKFAPDDNVTREQMAVIMYNFATFLKKTEPTEVSLTYPDSASISSWANEGAKYCQQTEVITGRDGGNFIPQDKATRAEVAAVIERFIKVIVEK